MSTTLEGYGVIRLGEVTAYGKREALDGLLKISLETESLSPDKRRELENYRTTSRPLHIQVPGDRKPNRGVVLGYESNQKTATFYVKRDGS